MKKVLRHLALLTTLFSGSAYSGALEVTVYNPGENGIFPVSSTLVTGEKEAILVDAQFSVVDGKNLVELIRQSGKKLTTVYISGGDPDFYFGLQPINAEFPNAKIIASQNVVEHIEKTKDAKLAYWGPILKEGAPQKLYVPEVSNQEQLSLEGNIIDDQRTKYASGLPLGTYSQNGVWGCRCVFRKPCMDGGYPDKTVPYTVDR